MKRNARSLAALSALAVVGLATPALATGAPAAAPTKVEPPRIEVMHLTVVPVSFIDTNPGYVSIDDDFNRKGEQVGSDVTTCRPVKGDPERAVCDVGLGLAGGLITITFWQSDDSNVAHGKVTGGTGAYAGVTGTVLIREGEERARVRLTLVH